MPRRLCHYAVFLTDDDFARWQRDNPDADVLSVQPYVSSVALAGAAEHAHGSTGISVFVLYSRSDEAPQATADTAA